MPSFLSLPIASHTPWMMMGASPSDGSSMIRQSGLVISPRPIASICCSPPDSVLAR